MEQDLGLSVEAITQHSQRLFSKSEELGQALTDILEKMKNLMENGQSYVDSESSKNFYEQISGFSKSCNKYILGVQKFASFLVDTTVASYEDVDQEILTLQTELKESLSHLEIVNKLGDAVTGVNESADGTIDSSQLDFSKISSTAGDTASGDFIQEGNVHKEYWEGELQLVPREDGTIQIVKDGTVMGYTTEEGVNLPDATDEAVATSTEEMNADLENGTAEEASVGTSTSEATVSTSNAESNNPVTTFSYDEVNEEGFYTHHTSTMENATYVEENGKVYLQSGDKYMDVTNGDVYQKVTTPASTFGMQTSDGTTLASVDLPESTTFEKVGSGATYDVAALADAHADIYIPKDARLDTPGFGVFIQPAGNNYSHYRYSESAGGYLPIDQSTGDFYEISGDIVSVSDIKASTLKGGIGKFY